LCGGTALSRCWLGHRVSYDLDFFLPEGFDARKMATALKDAGISFETRDIVDDLSKANQLHGYAIHRPVRSVYANQALHGIASVSVSIGRF